MTPLFQYELLNQPFGDPVLYVRLAGERNALLFDLGELHGLEAGKLFKVSTVFVSHTHMDHFIGFDHLIRLHLAREKAIRIYGPRGIIRNVQGKLRGYTWNLVDGYQFVIEAIELSSRSLRRVRFACKDRFKAGPAEKAAWDGTVDVHPHYTVRALVADHGIASIAYALEERFHININKDRLLQSGMPVGKWLRDLKDAIWEGRPDSLRIRVPDASGSTDTSRSLTLGEVKEQVVTMTRGQKLVYISDCRGTEQNFRKLIPFAAGADVLFCEAGFLECDCQKAADRGHLTARQAGFIAREAGAGSLRILHFSPRYEHCPDLLYQEAEEEFRGDQCLYPKLS
jgi:ribonuclease Z